MEKKRRRPGSSGSVKESVPRFEELLRAQVTSSTATDSFRDLEKRAQTKLQRDMTEAERVDIVYTRRFLPSLRKLKKLEAGALRAIESNHTFVAMIVKDPVLFTKDPEFYFKALDVLVAKEVAARRDCIRHIRRHMDLIKRGHQSLGAAKARDAKARKRRERSKP